MLAPFCETGNRAQAGLSTSERIDRNVRAVPRELEYRGPNVGVLACVKSCVGADRASEVELVARDIDGDDAGTESSCNHNRGESDTAAAVDCDPLPFGDARLVHHCAKRCGETTPQARGSCETQLIRYTHQIKIRAMDGDVLGEGAPVRETGLQLVIADLLISRAARPACAAGADEGYCDSITDLPTNDMFALGGDLAGKLVPRNVRHANIRVVPHPSVPITSAKTSSFDGDHHAVIGRHGIVDTLDAQRLSELVVDSGFHDESSWLASHFSL